MPHLCLCVFFRIWCAGVILPHARTGDRAGSRERPTLASARLGGLVSTATSPVCPVKLQPSSKVNKPILLRSSGCLRYVKHLIWGLLERLLCVISGVDVAHLCRNSGQCLDAGNTHYCRCQAGYTGSYCQEQVDECSPNPCQNGATCTDYLGGYSCEVGVFFFF